MSLQSLSALFEKAKKSFPSWEGLSFSIALVMMLYYVISVGLGDPVRRTLNILLNTPRADDILTVAYLLGYLVVVFPTIAIWLYKRRIPLFMENKAGILFSSANSEDLAQEDERLQLRVQAELKNRDLLNLIDIHALPQNIRISDHYSASAIRKKANAILVVWGQFEKSQIDGRTLIGFPKINFTYGYPANVPVQFHQDVGLSLLGRKWASDEKHEFIEKSVVIENIAQVTLNIIGMALLLKGLFEQAEAIFAVLDVDLEPHRFSSSPPGHLLNFCASVRKKRAKAVFLQLQREYRTAFRSEGVNSVQKNQLSHWNRRISEVIKLDKW